MKPLFPSLLLTGLFFAFMGCSDGGAGGSGGGGGSSSGSGGGLSQSCRTSSVDGLLQCAVNELKKEHWDEAVAYYDAAYEKNNDDAKAIIYSTLANLAKISIDPKVVALMKNHFGFTTYPEKLNALLSDSWMKEYKDEYEDCSYNYYNWNYSCTTGYDNIMLPAITTPNWVKGSGSMYNKAILSGNVLSFDNWAISLFANIVDKNSEGLNTLLDDVTDGVFGASYNLAVERLKRLENRTDRIKLDPYFIEQLDLEDIFDEHDQIGWPEVNAVLSAMLLVKASLEWVQSYDFSIDLNWLKYSWKEDSDDVLNHFRSVDAQKLPFNNNFLKPRSGKMAKAKTDYIKAIRGFQSSYTAIKNGNFYPGKVKDAYNTINGGIDALIAAIDEGKKFYIPEEPTQGTWPTRDRSDVVAIVDLERFFREGYLSLQNIFVTTSGGSPVFYLNKVKLTSSNYASLIDNGGSLQLKLNPTYIEDIRDMNNDIEEYIETGIEGELAKVLFKKYY